MKRSLFSCLFLCALFILCLTLAPLCACVQVDTEKDSSLTVQYKYEDDLYEGLSINVYKIADVMPDGTFKLTEEFKDYHIDLYGVATQEEWKTVTSTACAYIEADSISPTLSLVTDSEGKAAAENIKPGLYLTTSVKVVTEDKTVIFDNFLTVIPDKNEDGTYNYDLTVYPKVTSYTPTGKDIGYKVIKLWKDADASEDRPESVKVEIFCNGELAYSESLSAENNWTYKWSAKDNGDSWTVCERDVDEAYNVSSEKEGNTFVITNTLRTPPGDGAQTGDLIAGWPFIACVLLIGVVTVAVIIWRRGRSK